MNALIVKTSSLPLNTAAILGPLNSGVYVQVGMGLGFYVPEDAYAAAQRAANEQGRIQFLSIDHDGLPIFGTRDECLARGCGLVAWITPV